MNKANETVPLVEQIDKDFFSILQDDKEQFMKMLLTLLKNNMEG
ncbi:hypothetical protein GAPWKB30_0537 [Gilliamella apicola]|nr:hypothetical protein GAPWKB30_0537 [Gilliamella apicola]